MTGPVGTGYTHEDLWALVQRWYDIAENEAVESGTQHGYRECADQLGELLGPLAFAATGVEGER